MARSLSVRSAVVTLVATLVTAACQADPAEEVADFAEIAAAGPTIELDPSGTSATLAVTTTIDAVCAVAFGETAAFGRLATDTDMAGGAHRDHLVVLTGLEPDTAYHYRLHGIGPDGRLYQSQTFTFHTPAASPDDAPGSDVATEAIVVVVSSEFSSAFAAANALDGDPGTEWSTRGDGDNAYVVIDLGRDVEVVAVAFHTRRMADGSAITETFTVTVDGADTYGPFPVGRAEVAFVGRVLRFDVHTSTGGNTGATMIEVFEAP